MRMGRLFGASMATALVVGVVGAATPSATAGDNDRSDWTGKRALKKGGNDEEGLRLLTGRNSWALLAREIERTPDDAQLYRLRERTGNTWASPEYLPNAVERLSFDTNANGWTVASYVYDGQVWGALHDPRGRHASAVALGPADVVGGNPAVLASDRNGLGAIVYGDRIYHRLPGGSGTDDPTTARWTTSTSTPGPAAGTSVDGAVHYAWAPFDQKLNAFWRVDGSHDLMRSVGTRATETRTVWSTPTVVATNETYVDFVSTSRGGRLVTNGAEGVVLRDYVNSSVDPATGFTNRRTTGQDAGTSPEYVVVDGRGDLTIAAKEGNETGAGITLWQEDRPQGRYLERATFVNGTRFAGSSVVVSPEGSITVVSQPLTDKWSPLKVKHLAAGKSTWTDWVSLATPKPKRGTYERHYVGVPKANGDVTVALNDAAGTYSFVFDAPRKVTRITRPANRVQRDRTYTVGWNTTWAYGGDWELRARVDKGKRYGKWVDVRVPRGERTRVVTRPLGEKRCYQARATATPGLVNNATTGWSEQRCVTVRR